MQVLVSLGVLASYVGSLAFLALAMAGELQHVDVYFGEAAMLLTFMLLGKLLESVAKKKTRYCRVIRDEGAQIWAWGR